MRNYPSDTLITKVKSLIFRFSIYQIILSISHVNIREPQLDDDVKQQLADLQGKGIDINKLLREILAKREEELEEEIEKLGAYINSYKNSGSWPIERTMLRLNAEYTFLGGFVSQLAYRYYNFKETGSGLTLKNNYSAGIWELSFGYRWQ